LYDKKLRRKFFINLPVILQYYVTEIYRNITVILPALQTPTAHSFAQQACRRAHLKNQNTKTLDGWGFAPYTIGEAHQAQVGAYRQEQELTRNSTPAFGARLAPTMLISF